MFSSKYYAHDGSTDREREREKDIFLYSTILHSQRLICITCIIVSLLSDFGHSEALAGNTRVGIKKSSQDIYSLISLPAWLWSSWYGPSTKGHSSKWLFCTSTALYLAEPFTPIASSDLDLAMILLLALQCFIIPCRCPLTLSIPL